MSESKTKILKFGRRVWQQAQKRREKIETFSFLGFTHYCGKSRRGYFVMGHKTNKGSLRRKLKETKEWLKRIRCILRLRDWWPVLKSKLIGHYNYFGISGNYRSIRNFYSCFLAIVFKWINRRSQKRGMNLELFEKYLQLNPLPKPRICYALY